MTQNPSSSQLNALAERLIAEHWDFYPTTGARIGRHEYDGRLPDFSPPQISRRLQAIRRGATELQTLDKASLDPDELLSHRMLELFLERELFTLEEMRPLENNPMEQADFLDMGNYVLRDYAPLEDRLNAATAALRQVPDFLHMLDASLRNDLSPTMVDVSIECYKGIAHFYRNELPGFAESVEDQRISSTLTAAAETAATAMDTFVKKLRTRAQGRDNGFAIGSRLYSRMLATTEGLSLPLERLVTIGQQNMADNLAHAREIAGHMAPSNTIQEVVANIGRNHPSAETLIPHTREMLDYIRQSLTDLDVISLPSEDRCSVVETPNYMRYLFAAMDTPGALETKSTESFYFVTPVEAHWTPAQAEEWLTIFHYNSLEVTSIHEVYPGHFVHSLHNRRGRTLPLVNRAVTSYAFIEGWAHYAEQMMLETGYGRGKPELLLTQLLEALVRNCRYLCSIAMHTDTMTVDEATQFFMEYGYMGRHQAQLEALRGTFDPGYVNYTLGKLMILKLRDDWRRERKAEFSLRAFHDSLLSYGAPPLPLLRQALLKDGSNPL